MPTYVVTGPDGVRYRVTAPEGATEAQVMARVRAQAGDKRPTSFKQGVAEGVTKPTANMARILTRTNPILNSLAVLGISPVDGAENVAKAAFTRSPNRGSTAGKIVGEVIGTLPTAFLPGGTGALAAIGQGMAGGALLSNMDDPRDVARNVTGGAIGGLLGQQVGKRVVAPIAERIGRTAPVRRLAERGAQAVSKATGRNVRPLPAPLTRPERTLSQALPDDMAAVRQNVDDAAMLNLPFSLADASPKLRQLGGSVARFSPDGRALAEANYGPRARGQADRAVNAIDQYLAPITDLDQRGAEIRQAAQAASRPFYDEARSRAAPVDEGVAAMLQTPAGKDALRRAYVIAQNEGRDPTGIGFDLDQQGEVILSQKPTFETLQLVKRGLDSRLEGFRNPISGKLDLEGNPEAQAIAGLTQRFNNRLGELNDAYRSGNEAYRNTIQRREALNLGRDVAANNVPQRQFDTALARQTDETLPEFQRGYATSMADTVNRQRLNTNPYNAVYGSTDQQAKVAAAFPEGSERFARQYGLEDEMARTATEVLGGSQTQPRAMADEMFQGGMLNNAAEAGMQIATGGGIPGAGQVVRALAPTIRDRMRMGLVGAQRKADALASSMFDTNAQSVQQLLEELARRQMEQRIRRDAYGRTLGLLGGPGAVLGVAAAQ